MKRFPIAAGALALATAAQACDVAMPSGLKWSPQKVPGWVAYDFEPSSGFEGKLLYRRVNQRGLPSGAGEQKLLAEHVNAVVLAVYGGKPGKLTIVATQDLSAEVKGGASGAKAYRVDIAQPGGAEPKTAGVVVRANTRPKTLTLIVTPMPPHAASDDLNERVDVATLLASHPGWECTAGDGP